MDGNLTLYLISFFLVTIFFFLSYSKKLKKIISHNHIYKLIIGLIFIIYLLFSALFKFEVGDVMLFSGSGWHLRHQIDFYWIDSDHTQYPFFPLMIYYHALANYLSEILPQLTFSFYLKALLIPVLFYVSYLINRANSRLAQIRFLLSPITFSVIAIHGQIDIVLLAFYLTTVNLINRNTVTHNTFLSAATYAFSIAAKTWSIIFLPAIVYYQNNFKKSLLWIMIVMFLLLTNIMVYVNSVFGSSFDTIWPALLRPGGPIGIWGLTLISSVYPPTLLLIQRHNLIVYALLLSLIIIISLWKSKSLIQASFLIVLGSLMITPNFGIQYLFWLVPFLYWVNPKIKSFDYSLGFTIICLPYLFTGYATVVAKQPVVSSSLSSLFSLLIWLYLIYGFIHFTKKSQISNQYNS